jgi:hypothetical protein
VGKMRGWPGVGWGSRIRNADARISYYPNSPERDNCSKVAQFGASSSPVCALRIPHCVFVGIRTGKGSPLSARRLGKRPAHARQTAVIVFSPLADRQQNP